MFMVERLAKRCVRGAASLSEYRLDVGYLCPLKGKVHELFLLGLGDPVGFPIGDEHMGVIRPAHDREPATLVAPGFRKRNSSQIFLHHLHLKA